MPALNELALAPPSTSGAPSQPPPAQGSQASVVLDYVQASLVNPPNPRAPGSSSLPPLTWDPVCAFCHSATISNSLLGSTCLPAGSWTNARSLSQRCNEPCTARWPTTSSSGFSSACYGSVSTKCVVFSEYSAVLLIIGLHYIGQAYEVQYGPSKGL